MSLISSSYSPLERSLLLSFSSMLEDMNRFDRSFYNPYWSSVPEARTLSIGVEIGEIENMAERFGVAVDVSHFRPEELKVNVAGNQLTIEGHHEEKNDRHGTIQRSFVRKYTLPDDVSLDELRSSVSSSGHLSIQAPKKNAQGPQPRAIPITRG